MKRIYHIICKVIFMTLPLTGGVGGGLLLSSCSNDITYEAAEPVAADNWGVYFAGSNTSSFARNASDENVLEFTLKRMNTKGSLEVPVELEVANGTFNAPSKAVFADGEESTTIEVTYEGLEQGKLSATLSLPAAYTNPYKVKNGYFKQSITVFEPVVVCSNIVIDYNSSTGVAHDIFGKVKSRILQVPGENHFFWENFLGSGITLAFKLDLDNGGTFDPKDIKNCEGGIIPLNHAYDDGEYGWTLCEEENPTDDEATSATWTPEGADLGVTDYIYFYNYYNGNSYLSIDFWDDDYQSGWGSIWSIVIDGEDDDQYDNYYFYMYY